MQTNNNSNDFFELDFKRAIKQFNWIKPYILEIAQEVGIIELFQNLIIEIVFDNSKIHFHMLDEFKPSNKVSLIKLPYSIFRQLLLTNFGRWLTANEFIEHIHAEYAEYSSPDVVSSDLLSQLKTLCGNWYKVHYLAAERFFSSDENLRSYFYDSNFMLSWQNEVVKSKHIFYLDYLSQKIQAKDKTVLDVGSGIGRLQRVYESSKEVTNVDISQPMLSRAKELSNSSKVTYCQADINNLPFEGNYFNIIIALQVMMHTSNPFRTLKYLSRFLEEEGEIWTDFTCNRRLVDSLFHQESFFTRIYSRDHVIDQCHKMGFFICETLEIPDRHDHYWLVLHLTRS
jgi:ubiquinone/menaquinone biosynthesis C-methylase UbiE